MIRIIPWSRTVHDAHAEADAEIEQDPSRNTRYWRLILPEGWELNNLSLSQDPRNINKERIGVTQVVDDIPFNVLFVQWEIAKRDGGRKTFSHFNTDGRESLKNLFGN